MSYVPGERWDRERFERARGRQAPVLEREYDEREYYSRPGFREERDVEEEEYRRPAPSAAGRGERERVFFEEREQYGPPVPYRPRRESVRYYDDRETVVNRGGDMVPFREREEDREIDIQFRRESQPNRRPQFIRRQSSLDTHDRKPLPRYGDRVREEVVIPRPPRRRSPPRYVEKEFEEISVAEPGYYGDEEYRPYRQREVETFRRRFPDNPSPPRGEEIFEEREEIDIQTNFPKRGKTRMPRRLVNIKAIIDLGYPYEEEGETIIIQQALGKEHIDEVIRISREINAAQPPPPEQRITYQIEAPAPAPQPMPPPILDPLPPPPPPVEEEEIIKRETTIIRENPSLAESATAHSRESSPSASTVTAHSRRSHRTSHTHHSNSRARSRDTHRSKSTRRHRSLSSGTSGQELVLRESLRESHDTALIFPGRDRRSQRSIQAEIKALEAEKKALKYEREAERYRHGNEVIIEKDYRDGTVEIKKDRRAPDPRLIKAMLATLT